MRANSYSRLEGAVVLPKVQVGRHARLTNVVIDHGVVIPEGLIVGEGSGNGRQALPPQRKWDLPDHPGDDRQTGLATSMKVLSVASELYPLIKTGGLADVAGALPLALVAHGVETKTLIPGYPAVMKAVKAPKKIHEFEGLLGEQATLLSARHEGLDILILDCPQLYERSGGPYLATDGRDYPDNWKRFAVLSKAGAEIAAGILPDFKPELVHVHDWQSALVPVYMRYAETPEVPSLITIHNIAFQGQFAGSLFPYLELPGHAFYEALEYYGTLSYLKSGIITSHAVSTVSPSYAEEILTPEFGMGLEGLIASRAPISTASSMASTPMSGTRPTTLCCRQAIPQPI